MATREIIRMGHPQLREKSSELSIDEITSKEIQQFIEDLKETMAAYNGIGIAAPQVGVNKQLALIHVPTESERYPEAPVTELYVIFNPKITVLDETTQGFWEGCLSVPGLIGYVERPRKVKIDYLDTTATMQSIVVEDFHATVFQHELDHLFGKLYIDRITDSTKFSYTEEFNQFHNGEESMEE